MRGLASPARSRRHRSGPFFEPRTYPLALYIEGECVAGPFCSNCGNPHHLHEDGERCVESQHWLFPRPRFKR